MRTYKPTASDTLVSIAEKISTIANETNGMVVTHFRGTEIVTCPDISPTIIVALYHAQLKEDRRVRSLVRLSSWKKVIPFTRP